MASARPGLGRSTATITVWNAVSRLTGFVRVLAVGAALGTTFLGNTYQSSNLVSNLLFEVLAAGLLSAPLVPAFVAHFDAGRRADAERLAGNLLGLALAGLGVLVLVLALLATGVMRLLTSGVPDAHIRAAEVRVGAFFLWFFLPQALLYCIGAVASALLNADRRFAAVAFAPVANNIVVTATMLAYVAARHGATGLELSLAVRLLLALGTTAGVVAMTAVPLVALRRRGIALRLGVDWRQPGLGAVARIGAWGGVLLAGTQVLVGVTLLLANRVEGGVVAYQIAFTFYLLPFALLAHPLFTALYPRLAADAAAKRWDAFAEQLTAGVHRTALLVLPAAGLTGALGRPALRLVRLGALHPGDADLVARVLGAYAVGLVGYALFQLLARAATATGDARLPAVVGLGVTVAGTALMLIGVSATEGRDRVVALGIAHSVAMLGGAAVLLLLLRHRVGQGLAVGASLTKSVVIGTATWVAAAGGAAVFSGDGRGRAAGSLALGAACGTVAAASVAWVLRVPELRSLSGHPV